MEQVCSAISRAIHDEYLFLIIPLIITLISLIFTLFIFYKSKIRGLKLYLALPGSIFGVLVSGFLMLIIVASVTESATYLIASKYFSVNGEIKIHCMFPTNGLICPKSKSEVLALNPNFADLLSEKDWDYRYYPETGEYTLLVRNDLFRGVIFDPLLQKLGHYDLVDTSYSCANTITAHPIKTEIWEQYKSLRQNDFPILKNSTSAYD